MRNSPKQIAPATLSPAMLIQVVDPSRGRVSAPQKVGTDLASPSQHPASSLDLIGFRWIGLTHRNIRILGWIGRLLNRRRRRFCGRPQGRCITKFQLHVVEMLNSAPGPAVQSFFLFFVLHVTVLHVTASAPGNTISACERPQRSGFNCYSMEVNAGDYPSVGGGISAHAV